MPAKIGIDIHSCGVDVTTELALYKLAVEKCCGFYRGTGLYHFPIIGKQDACAETGNDILPFRQDDIHLRWTISLRDDILTCGQDVRPKPKSFCHGFGAGESHAEKLSGSADVLGPQIALHPEHQW